MHSHPKENYGYSEFFLKGAKKYKIINKMTLFLYIIRQNADAVMGTFFHNKYVIHSMNRSLFVFKSVPFRSKLSFWETEHYNPVLEITRPRSFILGIHKSEPGFSPALHLPWQSQTYTLLVVCIFCRFLFFLAGSFEPGSMAALFHTANKIRFKYSQKWNCAASFPISTIRCSKIGGPILGIYKSLTDTWM